MTATPPGSAAPAPGGPQGPAGAATAGQLWAGIQAAQGSGMLGKHAAGPRRRRLGEVLVEQKVISDEQLNQLLGEQAAIADPSKRPRLGRLVVTHGLASERQVAQAVATALGLPLVDLSRVALQTEVARMLPKLVSERHSVVIVGRHPDRNNGGQGDAYTVAMSDPTNVVALDDVRLYTKGAELTVVVAVESELRQLLGRLWHRTEDAEEVVAGLDTSGEGGGNDDLSAASEDGTDAPIVKLVEVLLADAAHQRASDLHVEPEQHEYRVRFRIDGVLREVMTVPKSAGPALISRLKIISGLDIAERRRPQDGRSRMQVNGEPVDLRVSTLPSLHGEKVVIRLLARAADLKSLRDIGMEDAQLSELMDALHQPQGLVLITGPTGSGKTSTLYGGIHQIRSPELNIVTLEDPVEIALPGVVQVQINVRSGLTFSSGLRSILRQDPDVVLVGEIRDAETAGLALEASMTGHLVLSTLHTNDAVGAITRLVELGIEPFLVGSSLSLVIAQRLVRRVCADCAEPSAPTDRQMQILGLTPADLESANVRKGTGCGQCGGTGYAGRLGVYEVLPVTAAVRSVLLTDSSEKAIATAARAGGLRSMRSNAVTKALRGETTFDEVLRATPVETHDESTARCPSCTLRLGADWLGCPRCGTDVSGRHCSSCSAALDEGWRFCPSCRAPQSSAYDEVAAPAHRDQLPIEAAPAAAPVPAPVTAPVTAPVPVAAPPVAPPPVAAPVAAPVPAPVATPVAAPAPALAPSAAPTARVLVVDHEHGLGARLQALLAGRASVVAVAGGRDALQRLAEPGWDAVVTDVALPDVSGLDLLRAIRHDARTSGLAVLMLSHAGDERLEIEARAQGADDWLSRQVTPEEVATRLERLLAARRVSSAA